MIAKNEEKFIGECLRHLKPIASEFILVDTGSEDRTVEIARAEGARVSQIKWENDFAKARNASLEKATQPWILIMDPDERISAKDLESLKALCQAKDVMAYSFRTRNYSNKTAASGFVPCRGEYPEEKNFVGYYESPKVRLFQNIPSIRFKGSVHELVETTITGRTVESSIPIHHYGNTSEVEAEKDKKTFYQQQTTKKAKENPQDWKAHFELGVEFLSSSQFLKATKALEKARELRPRDPLVLSNLGYAYMESGLLEKAREVLDECLQNDPKYHDGLLNLGVSEMRQSRFQEALKIFDRLLKEHPGSFLAYRNRGIAMAHLKNYQGAAANFERALKIFPQFVDARVDLGVVCCAAGRLDLAKPILEDAVKMDPSSVRARSALDQLQQTLSKATR